MKDLLQEIRGKIDEIDAGVLRLLSRRASLALAAAKVKRREQKDYVSCYRPEREAFIISNAVENNPGPLSAEAVAIVFREIISACLAVEEEIVVAYLGPQGTYTEEAALKHFGQGVKTLSCGSIEDVFAATLSDKVGFGVAPVESAVGGGVANTLDCFVDYPLRISGEIELEIHHMLLAKTDKLEELRALYAHEQSIMQCRSWLSATLPHCRLVKVGSNAQAARMVNEEEGACAIAGRKAAERYKLLIVREHIEDQSFNSTRFLVISDHPMSPPSGRDKTSVLATSFNRPGSLVDLLNPFAERSLSMTRIASRPARRSPWEYMFFIDILGHCEEEPLKEALAELESRASFYRLLGSYPLAMTC